MVADPTKGRAHPAPAMGGVPPHPKNEPELRGDTINRVILLYLRGRNSIYIVAFYLAYILAMYLGSWDIL